MLFRYVLGWCTGLAPLFYGPLLLLLLLLLLWLMLLLLLPLVVTHICLWFVLTRSPAHPPFVVRRSLSVVHHSPSTVVHRSCLPAGSHSHASRAPAAVAAVAAAFEAVAAGAAVVHPRCRCRPLSPASHHPAIYSPSTRHSLSVIHRRLSFVVHCLCPPAVSCSRAPSILPPLVCVCMIHC